MMCRVGFNKRNLNKKVNNVFKKPEFRQNSAESGGIRWNSGGIPEELNGKRRITRKKKWNSGGIPPEKIRKFSIEFISFIFLNSGKKRCVRIKPDSGGIRWNPVEFHQNSPRNSASVRRNSPGFQWILPEFHWNSGEFKGKFRGKHMLFNNIINLVF